MDIEPGQPLPDEATRIHLAGRPDPAMLDALQAYFERFPDATLSLCASENDADIWGPNLAPDLGFLGDVPAVRNLAFFGLEAGATLPDALPGIETVSLKTYGKVDLSPFASLPSLQTAKLHSDQRVANLKPLANHAKLRTLECIGKFSGHQVLCTLPQLDTVRVPLPKKGIAGFGEPLPVRRADLRATKAVPLEGLSAWPHLEDLGLSKIPATNDALAELRDCAQLRSLTLSVMDEYTDLSFLAGHPQLRELWILGGKSLKSLAALPDLPELRVLRLSATTTDRHWTRLDYAPLFDCGQLWKVQLNFNMPKHVFDTLFRPMFDKGVKVVG